MNTKIEKKNANRYSCTLMDQDKKLGHCIINTEDSIWTISSWYVDKESQHSGYGKELMKNLLIYLYINLGSPRSVEYIWNGTNQYVYHWITANFDARCKSPIAVQKYQSDDDWTSHIYVMDTYKFMRYFGLDPDYYRQSERED